MTEKGKERMKIDDLLNGTDYKKMKEYMRTDKPSTRKLHIEIYEFKDKKLLENLPTKEENKADEAKEAMITYKMGTREIIKMKLRKLNRDVIEFLRLKEYSAKYSVDAHQIERLIDRGHMRTYGNVLPDSIEQAHERYYLVTERSGKILGLIGIAFRTQVEGNGKLKCFGGDVIVVGVLQEKRATVFELLRKLYEQKPFKKLPILRLPTDLGEAIFEDRTQNEWIHFTIAESRNYGWMTRRMRNDLRQSRTDYLSVYYNRPPINELANAEQIVRWQEAYRTNFEIHYNIAHPLNTDGMTTEEMIAEEKRIHKEGMIAECNAEMGLELNRINQNYQNRINAWNEVQREVLSRYSNELYEMSASGVLTGAGRHQVETSEDNGDNDGGDNEDSNLCEHCDRYTDSYCVSECPHSPCDNCSGEDCGDCDYNHARHSDE